MSNVVAIQQMNEQELISVLQNSLYPGASIDSVKMVIGYCRAAQLDPIQKPVHIVPMWDSKAGAMRDVVMPGINLYRTQAARSGECAGVSEPEFGDDITANLGGVNITYPKWCRVVVKRRLPSGEIVEFAAKELWIENYAVKGGKEKSVAPNAMWTKRPYGQIAKCAEAQAFRKAFPEMAGAYTAEEMEGKALNERDITPITAHRADESAQYITAEQAATIRNKAFAAGINDDAVCSKGRVASIELIEASRYDAVIKYLDSLPAPEVVE